MSYWLEDARGKYLGDFSTNLGLASLRARGGALQKFVDAGEADDALMKQVVKETATNDSLAYIAEMLQNTQPPIYITDGSEHANA